MISECDGWLAAWRIARILNRGESAWTSRRSLLPLLITVHVILIVLNLSSKLVATILLVVIILFLIFIFRSKWCLLCCELIIVKQLLRSFLRLLPRVIFGFWLEYLGLFFRLILAFHIIIWATATSPLTLPTVIRRSIRCLIWIVRLSTIVGLTTVIPTTDLWSLSLCLCFLLKVTFSHTHSFSTKSLWWSLTWWWFLRPLNTTAALFSKIYFLFWITRIFCFCWSTIRVERTYVLCLVWIISIVSKCNLGFILGTCRLVICLINVIIGSSKWLTHSRFYPIKSLFTFKPLTCLSQRKIRLTSWIMM